MLVALKVSRLFPWLAPLSVVGAAACATPVYDYDTDVSESGGAPGRAGSGPLGSAGSAAGARASAGSPGSAGSVSAAGGLTGGSGSSSFGGSGGTPGAAGTSSAGSSGATTGSKCSAEPWQPNTAYRMGDKATKSGKEYTAAGYTMADPDAHCCGNGQDWVSSIPCN